MGQTVNLLASPSEVRILLPPPKKSGSSSVGRASAFQAEGRGFEPRLPLAFLADVAQLVERFLGKEEVRGSNPLIGSIVNLFHEFS